MSELVAADESLVSTLVQRGVDPDTISEARLWSMSHRKMADRKGPRKLVEDEQCAVWSVIRHVLELYMNACVARSWKAPLLRLVKEVGYPRIPLRSRTEPIHIRTPQSAGPLTIILAQDSRRYDLFHDLIVLFLCA